MQTENKMAVMPVGKLIWQMSIPQIPAGNRQVKRRSDGEQHRPLLWRTCRDLGFGRWLRKHLCGGWKLPETLRGVGAIALGYPGKESGQTAARKQNYIVRI